jgi:hypothetical protein|tara:strand:+ start:2163 stop:2624 length:462 start_codon:yes stop_codon:yes gene_type:complete
MKRAQTEIAGLTIIIILVLIGVMFAVRFIASEETVDYKKEFRNAQLGSNMIDDFLATTSSCNSFSMTELLQDCGQEGNILCYGMGSCDYAKSTAQQIFLETLEKWNIDYEFMAFDDDRTFFTLGSACIGDKKSRLFPVPTDSGILSVKLDICG